MIRRPPRSTRTVTRCPYTTLFRSAPEQFAGVMSNLKVLLEGLLDKNLFWVLSGNEVPLVVNDPNNPLVVCLGNTPTEKGILPPILSMIMAVDRKSTRLNSSH